MKLEGRWFQLKVKTLLMSDLLIEGRRSAAMVSWVLLYLRYRAECLIE